MSQGMLHPITRSQKLSHQQYEAVILRAMCLWQSHKPTKELVQFNETANLARQVDSREIFNFFNWKKLSHNIFCSHVSPYQTPPRSFSSSQPLNSMISFSLFTKTNIHVGGTCVPQGICRGQKASLWDQFSPSTMWVPPDQAQALRLGSRCPYGLSHLVSPTRALSRKWHERRNGVKGFGCSAPKRVQATWALLYISWVTLDKLNSHFEHGLFKL